MASAGLQDGGQRRRCEARGYNQISIAATLVHTLLAHPFPSPGGALRRPFIVSAAVGGSTGIRALAGMLLLAGAVVFSASVRADALAEVEALHKDGKSELALQQADAAITLQPRAAPMRFLKAVMLSDLGRNEEAIGVYLALTQDFPELADPYNNLAVLYASSGRLDDALAALQAALRNDPAHRRARENLGDVYLALAVQAWTSAEQQSQGEDALLLRKLKQAEIIAPKSVTQGASRSRR